MRIRNFPTSIALAALSATVTASLVSCVNHAAGRAANRSSADAAPSLQDRIAHSLAAASPLADPADSKARDAAGDRLSQCADLAHASGDGILWGGFDAKKGYDPAAYSLTEFNARVWAKLYLSAYMFPGQYEVRKEGRFTVLDVSAKFRGSLDSGEYPYPFWHSAKKWQAYSNTASVFFVFDGDRLIAAYRHAETDPTKAVVEKKWDGRWHWTDAQGGEQPRVALYSYLLSPNNPHRADLESSYRQLEERFRAQNCISCHAPDNKAQASELLLLNFPNQALAARHSLAAVLRGNRMPPPDPVTGDAAGIHDDASLAELIHLAEAFEKEADAALAFEGAPASASKGATR